MKNFILNPFKFFFFDRSIPSDILFFSTITILIPIALITGPAIPDIILSIIALFFLIKSLINRIWKYYKNPIVYGFLIFSFYGILRSVFSEYPIESLANGGSVFFFRYIFFAMGIWYLLDNNPYLAKCLALVIALCITLICADGLYQYFNGSNILGYVKIDDGHRLTGLFRDEPIIGRYISYLSIFAFALIYQNYQLSKKMIVYLLFFLVMCASITFLSGERAPTFNIFLFVIFILIFTPKYRFYKFMSIVICLIIIFFITLINPIAKERMFDVTSDQVSSTKIKILPYSEMHERHYISALKMFQSQPIFGLGTNSFRLHCNEKKYQYKENSCTTHPHNFYIQILAELGIVGFLFIFSFFCYFVYKISKQLIYILSSKKEKIINFENFLFFIILFIYWWPLIPHMSLYNNWNNVLMMMPLGFLMRYLYNNSGNGNFNEV